MAGARPPMPQGGQGEGARACLEQVAIEPMHVPLYHAWGQLELEQNNVTAARHLPARRVGELQRARDDLAVDGVGFARGALGTPSRHAPTFERRWSAIDSPSMCAIAGQGNFEARARSDLAAAQQLFEGAVRIDRRMRRWGGRGDGACAQQQHHGGSRL